MCTWWVNRNLFIYRHTLRLLAIDTETFLVTILWSDLTVVILYITIVPDCIIASERLICKFRLILHMWFRFFILAWAIKTCRYRTTLEFLILQFIFEIWKVWVLTFCRIYDILLCLNMIACKICKLLNSISWWWLPLIAIYVLPYHRKTLKSVFIRYQSICIWHLIWIKFFHMIQFVELHKLIVIFYTSVIQSLFFY